jgi:hypothetical protein
MAYLACLAVCAGILIQRRSAIALRRILIPAGASLAMLLWYVASRVASHQLGGHRFYDPWTLRHLVPNFVSAFAVFHLFLP